MATRFSLMVLVITLLLAAPLAYSKHQGLRATMTRTEAGINYTRAALRSHARLSMLAANLNASTQVPLQMDSSGGAYDMTFSIGTPPQTLSALADTGSDLIWVKCGACVNCSPQGSPSYYPNTSSSFSKLPCSNSLCGDLTSQCGNNGGAECDYIYSYGVSNSSNYYTKGYFSSENFTFGGDAVPGVGFGCNTMSEGSFGTSSGLVGLGRGPLSLVSQLNAGAFSYCLTDNTSSESPLLFGSLAVLSGDNIQSTPLLSASTYYSVNLQNISIGTATTLGTGSNGIIFDSGTTVTLLADPAYTLAKAAVLAQTNLTVAAGTDGYEACFQVPDTGYAVMPSMVLHFDGADMAPPVENYFDEVADGVICWIVQKSPSLSIIGNIMQMNYHVRYDVDNSVVSFQPANCDSL